MTSILDWLVSVITESKLPRCLPSMTTEAILPRCPLCSTKLSSLTFHIVGIMTHRRIQNLKLNYLYRNDMHSCMLIYNRILVYNVLVTTIPVYMLVQNTHAYPCHLPGSFFYIWTHGLLPFLRSCFEAHLGLVPVERGRVHPLRQQIRQIINAPKLYQT